MLKLSNFVLEHKELLVDAYLFFVVLVVELHAQVESFLFGSVDFLILGDDLLADPLNFRPEYLSLVAHPGNLGIFLLNLILIVGQIALNFVELMVQHDKGFFSFLHLLLQLSIFVSSSAEIVGEFHDGIVLFLDGREGILFAGAEAGDFSCQFVYAFLLDPQILFKFRVLFSDVVELLEGSGGGCLLAVDIILQVADFIAEGVDFASHFEDFFFLLGVLFQLLLVGVDAELHFADFLSLVVELVSQGGALVIESLHLRAQGEEFAVDPLVVLLVVVLLLFNHADGAPDRLVLRIDLAELLLPLHDLLRELTVVLFLIPEADGVDFETQLGNLVVFLHQFVVDSLEVLLHEADFALVPVDFVVVVGGLLPQSVGQVFLLLDGGQHAVDFGAEMVHFVEVSLLLADGLLELGVVLLERVELDLLGSDFLAQFGDEFVLLVHDALQPRIVGELVGVEVALEEDDVVVVLVDGVVELVDFLLQVENLILLGGNRNVLLAQAAHCRLQLQDLVVQLPDDIVLPLQFVVDETAPHLLLRPRAQFVPQLFVLPLEIAQLSHLQLQVGNDPLLLFLVVGEVQDLLFNSAAVEDLLLAPGLSLLRAELDLPEFGLEFVCLLGAVLLVVELEEMQRVFQIANPILVLLGFLVQSQVVLDFLLAGLPGVLLLELDHFPLEPGDGALVGVLLGPEFGLQFEDGLVVLLETLVKAVHDVLGLLGVVEVVVDLPAEDLGVAEHLAFEQFALLPGEEILQFLVLGAVELDGVLEGLEFFALDGELHDLGLVVEFERLHLLLLVLLLDIQLLLHEFILLLVDFGLAVVLGLHSDLAELLLIDLDDPFEFGLQLDDEFVVAEYLHLEGVDGHRELLLLLETALVAFLVGLVLPQQVAVGVYQFLQLPVQLQDVRLQRQQLVDPDVLHLLQSFLVVQQQLDPALELQDALLQFLPGPVLQGDFARLHHDDLPGQQLVLLLEALQVAGLLLQVDFLLVRLQNLPLQVLDGFVLAVDLGLEFKNVSLEVGAFADGLLLLVEVHLLEFCDLVAEGLEVGLDGDHLLDQVGLPVVVLVVGVVVDVLLQTLHLETQVVVEDLQCRVLLAQHGDLFGELLAGQRLDVDHFQFLRLQLHPPVLLRAHQLVLQLSDPLLVPLRRPCQVRVVLLVVLDGAVELRLLVPQHCCQVAGVGLAGGALCGGDAFGLLVGNEGLPLLGHLVELLVLVEGDLVLQFGDGVLELLVVEFEALEGDDEAALLLEEGVDGLAQLLPLGVGESLQVHLPHVPQVVQFLLDLLVGSDDFLD